MYKCSFEWDCPTSTCTSTCTIIHVHKCTVLVHVHVHCRVEFHCNSTLIHVHVYTCVGWMLYTNTCTCTVLSCCAFIPSEVEREFSWRHCCRRWLWRHLSYVLLACTVADNKTLTFHRSSTIVILYALLKFDDSDVS